MFVQKLKEHKWIQCMMSYVCQNVFQQVWFGKRRLFLVLSKQIPHYPPLTLFHIFDAHFPQKHLLDPMAFCLAVLARSYLKVARMFGGQTFLPASFWRNYLKSKFFQRAGVIYCCNFLAYYPLLGFPLSISDLICIVSSIPSLAHFFLFFTNFWPKINCAKNEFSTDFLQNLKFKRFSVLQGLAYHMNRKTILLRVTKLVSDANLHFERMFLFGFLLELVKQQISLLFDYISKKFYGIVQIMNLNRSS